MTVELESTILRDGKIVIPELDEEEEITVKKINNLIAREALLIQRAEEVNQDMEDIVQTLGVTMSKRYILEGRSEKIPYISTEITRIFELKNIPFASSVRRALNDFPEFKDILKKRESKLNKASAEVKELTPSQLQDRVVAESKKLSDALDILKKSKNILKAIEKRADNENIDLQFSAVKSDSSNSFVVREAKRRIKTLKGMVGDSLFRQALHKHNQMFLQIEQNIFENSPALSPQLDKELADLVYAQMDLYRPYQSKKNGGDNFSYLNLAKWRQRVTKYKAARMHMVPTTICKKCSEINPNDPNDIEGFKEMEFVPFEEVFDDKKKKWIQRKNFYKCSVCGGTKAIMHQMSYENVNSRADQIINTLDHALTNIPLHDALVRWYRTFQWQKNATVKERAIDQWNNPPK